MVYLGYKENLSLNFVHARWTVQSRPRMRPSAPADCAFRPYRTQLSQDPIVTKKDEKDLRRDSPAFFRTAVLIPEAYSRD
jgi:hypothetical protein